MRANDARKLDHKTLEEIRIRAVERVQAGESPELVIRTLGFSRACIYEWLARYRAGGWAALKAQPVPGRPKRITGRQLEWLYQTIVGTSPLEHRFEFGLWTRPMIGVLLWEQFRLKLSLASIGRLLRQLGLTAQRPLFRASEQDPLWVRRWVQEDYPKIRALAKACGAKIFFGDEAGVRNDYHGGTTWALRGQTPVVRSTGQRFRWNMLSAISAQGQLRFMVAEGKFDAAMMITFLERLLQGAPQPIFLVVDRHPVHKSRLVKRYLVTDKNRLQVFFLPAYSPELNPDEQVWNDIKHHAAGRTALRDKQHFRKVVTGRLFSLQRQPDKVRSFFQHPETRYAA